MNRLALSIALVAAAAAPFAFADGAEREAPVSRAGVTADRTAVQTDAVAARSAGRVVDGERAVVADTTAGTADRARVAAEAAEARRLGVTAVGEVTPVATAEQASAIRTAGDRAAAARMAGLR